MLPTFLLLEIKHVHNLVFLLQSPARLHKITILVLVAQQIISIVFLESIKCLYTRNIQNVRGQMGYCLKIVSFEKIFFSCAQLLSPC